MGQIMACHANLEMPPNNLILLDHVSGTLNFHSAKPVEQYLQAFLPQLAASLNIQQVLQVSTFNLYLPPTVHKLYHLELGVLAIRTLRWLGWVTL